ncbi:hypothetical protein [Prosthecochloris sp.]|uniref:hypothetical protein n=1 Tax=Prosthecochloris sp. TaxID=290513 RepID=UPI0025EBA30A|nr:hypothetical protein [Prosthecochloris sp.]
MAEIKVGEEDKKNLKTGCGCLTVLLLLFGIAVFTCQDDTPWQERDSSVAAYVHLKYYVKEQLKSPGTAKFADAWSGGYTVQDIGDQKYRIVSWVDAQNSFGALIRMYFYGKVQQTAEDEWEVLEFEWRPD